MIGQLGLEVVRVGRCASALQGQRALGPARVGLAFGLACGATCRGLGRRGLPCRGSFAGVGSGNLLRARALGCLRRPLQQIISLHIPGLLVIAFDQQPLVLLALHRGAHQFPPALEPFTVQDEVHLAGRDRLQRIAIAGPGAVVVDVHMPGAVMAAGDIAGKRRVGQRVIFNLHREPFFTNAQRGAFRHRPALEHAVGFQPEVVMARAGVVQLHHEDRSPRRRAAALGIRLGGAIEAAFAAVFLQGHVGLPGFARGRALGGFLGRLACCLGRLFGRSGFGDLRRGLLRC